MPDFSQDPPLPKKVTNEAFMQTVRLLDAGKPIGSARWHARPGAMDGVAQLLDLTITERGRQGHGGQLIDEVVKQARAYFKSRGTRLRRMWMAVEQKGQIIGRAFLTEHGFHHVGTMSELMKGQDTLLYMKSFD
jgi:GNAT superfamily N-acetyltransferase